MVASSSLKTLNSLHVFSMKTTTTTSSSFSSMKMKTLLETFILSHLYRIARALTKAKAILVEVVKDIHLLHLIEFPSWKRNKNKRKLFFGSFRLHYNWCSSHVMPMPVLEGCCSTDHHVYNDSSWNSVFPKSTSTHEYDETAELSGYLRWLEEKGAGGDEENPSNEIDRLADLFIQNCHEKFRLEKQESYRRFQEMMARSV